MPDNIALTEAVYYILLAARRPIHGYGIIQEAARMSGGRVMLAAGTLYGAINAMLEKGWLEMVPSEEPSRKKEYLITAVGYSIMKTEIARLRELLKNGRIFMEEYGNENNEA